MHQEESGELNGYNRKRLEKNQKEETQGINNCGSERTCQSGKFKLWEILREA